eukprot:CAMPEP_0178410896 /NCGR_PEP_ID=MMETSP0689_2-20121128/21219_1 /TAXON_ID=160604 /ORGANISM="Amphidinium massartii, Strain CS-259" /LENGTH=305 /DNA_ID=CAMNT_0020032093 /DNA_START=25 /DNA_END=938 /DNA_ORIENTATION=+
MKARRVRKALQYLKASRAGPEQITQHDSAVGQQTAPELTALDAVVRESSLRLHTGETLLQGKLAEINKAGDPSPLSSEGPPAKKAKVAEETALPTQAETAELSHPAASQATTASTSETAEPAAAPVAAANLEPVPHPEKLEVDRTAEETASERKESALTADPAAPSSLELASSGPTPPHTAKVEIASEAVVAERASMQVDEERNGSAGEATVTVDTDHAVAVAESRSTAAPAPEVNSSASVAVDVVAAAGDTSVEAVATTTNETASSKEAPGDTDNVAFALPPAEAPQDDAPLASSAKEPDGQAS